MPDSDMLAATSYNLVVSAAVVYALAMVAFAGEWAFGRRGLATRSARGTREAVTGAAGGAVLAAARAAGGAASVAELDSSTTGSAAPAASGDASGPGLRARSGETEELRDAAASAALSDDLDRPARLGRIGISLSVLAFLLHLAGLVARGWSAGRVPWGNMYEFLTSGSAVAMAVFLFLLWRGQDVRWLGAFVVTPVLLALGLATTVFYVRSTQLMPALHSYRLVVHVVAAVVATGLLTVGTIATALHLFAAWRESAGRGLPYVGARQLPGAAVLDQLAYRIYAFAFPIWTFAVMAGAIWAESAWGRYWDWDPKEVWSFITWVVFAAYLHARATAGWKGRSAAIIALVGYACLIFNFVGVNIWIVGLHSYAGVK
jgi:cytochrome c-type biogenesis protein CcsB